MIVDQLHDFYPPLQKDAYWNQADPDMPYTNAAADLMNEPFLGSAALIE